MPSTLDGKNDPHDVLEIAPDVVLVARAATEFPSLAPDAAHHSPDRPPSMGSGFSTEGAPPRVDTSFRATDTSGGRSHGGWAKRFLIAFLFALCSAFAAAAWERYGDDAQATVAGIAPQIVPTLMSWLPMQRPATAAQTDAAPVAQPAASTDQAAPPAPPEAQPADNTTTAAATPAAPAAASSPDQAELLQSMARDVASLTQQVGELKATIAQLKANQEQMTRDKAKVPEARVSEARPAEPRPTKLGAPPRSLGTLPVQRPRPPAYNSYPPAQAAYVPPPPPPPSTAAPVQVAPPPPVTTPDGDPVVRPPMPVR